MTILIASVTLRFMNRVHSSNTISERYLARLRQAAGDIERALDRTTADEAADAGPPVRPTQVADR